MTIRLVEQLVIGIHFMLISPVLGSTQGRGEYTGSGPDRAVLLVKCSSCVADVHHFGAGQQTLTASECPTSRPWGLKDH
jgi:hypothetical protein